MNDLPDNISRTASSLPRNDRTRGDLLARIQELQTRLADGEETLRAIRGGEVDALIVDTKGKPQVYTLHGADEPYRVFVEQIREGAATLSAQGHILYCNRQFAEMLGEPMETVIGTSFERFVRPDHQALIRALFEPSSPGSTRIEIPLGGPSRSFPAYLSLSTLHLQGVRCTCILVVDLTSEERTRKLEAAERLTASILEQSAEAILVLDPGGSVSRANPAARNLGAPLESLRPPELAARLFRVAQTGEPIQRAEAELPQPDGSCRNFMLSAVPLPNDAGVVVTLTDITKQKQTEFELLRRKAILDAFSSGTDNFMFVKDRQGRYLMANPSMVHALGFRSEAELIGKTDGEILTNPEHARLVMANDRRVMETGHAEVVEETAEVAIGNRSYLVAKHPYTGPGGETIGLIGTAFDITERRRDQALLEASNNRFRRLIDSNIVGIVVATEDSVIEANDLYLDMLGYSREDLLQGKVSWTAATPAEHAQLARDAIEELSTRGVCRPFEKEYVRKDGSRVPVLMGAAALATEPRLEWICFAVDLTDRKSLEDQLRSANGMLARSNEDLQRFAYAATHDLQEPLRTITAFSQLLGRDEPSLSPQSHHHIARITDAATRMQRLIQDLLAYSRVNTEAPLIANRVDCQGLYYLTLSNLSHAISECGARISCDPLPCVTGDDGRLLQVFQNLISNSIKYRSHHPLRVHVGVEADGDQWHFSIRDNGIGFDMQYADKIFGVFQRLHAHAQIPGTGVGLAIVKRIVEHHGGRIWPESAPGQGATFHFTLPKWSDG